MVHYLLPLTNCSEKVPRNNRNQDQKRERGGAKGGASFCSSQWSLDWGLSFKVQLVSYARYTFMVTPHMVIICDKPYLLAKSTQAVQARILKVG